MSSTKIAILNSRQGLYPCRLHEWVKQTLKVLHSLRKSETIIVSSIGMSTWDIVTIIASKLQLRLELHIQQSENISDENMKNIIVREYNLNSSLVSFIMIDKNEYNKFQIARDISILDSAERLIPISVRPNGNLEKLLLTHDKKTDNSFQLPYKKKRDKISYTLKENESNPIIRTIKDTYICHWTRTSKSKYNHEREYDFYNKILQSDLYPRTAIQNLLHIIEHQTIYATATHMSQNIPTVSFTSLTPIEMIPLFKWRSRYSEMSFEPYGIGIKKEVTFSNNIQEVIYYDKTQKNIFTESDEEIWLTQSNGIVTNWEKECELRHLGNFNFSNISVENILLFTRYKKEASQLHELTGYKTISFEI